MDDQLTKRERVCAIVGIAIVLFLTVLALCCGEPGNPDHIEFMFP